jgi:XTP/dITP diphosphohydrolase
VRLLVATTNPGKLREFRDLLGGGAPGFQPLEIQDLSSYPGIPVPEETGRTFADNACLKASYYAKHLRMFAMADDSGLSVDSLAGKPGVHSARWAELHNSGRGDADNNALLLRQLDQVPDDRRTARFVCVLALSDPEGRILLTASDSVEGRILRAPRGENGFGYDPLFFIPALGRTTAELPSAEKHAISHRGLALRRMHRLITHVTPALWQPTPGGRI